MFSPCLGAVAQRKGRKISNDLLKIPDTQQFWNGRENDNTLFRMLIERKAIHKRTTIFPTQGIRKSLAFGERSEGGRPTAVCIHARVDYSNFGGSINTMAIVVCLTRIADGFWIQSSKHATVFSLRKEKQEYNTNTTRMEEEESAVAEAGSQTRVRLPRGAPSEPSPSPPRRAEASSLPGKNNG